MRRRILVGLLLLACLGQGSCFLLDKTTTQCGEGRPCQVGWCSPETSTCVPLLDMVAGDQHVSMMDLAPDRTNMVQVMGGTYLMGTWPPGGDMTTDVDTDSQSNEQPAHSVTLSTFYLDKTEVTVAAYAECVQAAAAGQATAKGCTLPDNQANSQYCNWGAGAPAVGDMGVPPDMEGTKITHPINCVDWHQATAYCAWRNKRLPTEEEWEYAARGMADSKYPWGSADPVANQVCWSGNNMNLNGTCEVGTYSDTLLGQMVPNQTGLKDMAGNVYEWTATIYCNDYTDKNCTTDYVIRGGSWYFIDPQFVRAASRNNNDASTRYDYIGFRCASD